VAGGGQRDEDDLITQINVTPLVDVVLVLLIILMVTASYIVSRSIPMELPQADTGVNTAQQRTLTVSIEEGGRLFIDATPIEDSELRDRIRQYLAQLEDRSQARAVIAADGRISHSRFIQVIDILRQEHVTHFAINVRPEDLQR
jgi:biopolymer transport protein ExbD